MSSPIDKTQQNAAPADEQTLSHISEGVLGDTDTIVMIMTLTRHPKAGLLVVLYQSQRHGHPLPVVQFCDVLNGRALWRW